MTKNASISIAFLEFEDLMTIELIIDKNCISNNNMKEIEEKIFRDFGMKIQRITFSQMTRKYKKISINIIPAWIINGELLQIHPLNYELLKKIIHQRLDDKTPVSY